MLIWIFFPNFAHLKECTLATSHFGGAFITYYQQEIYI